MRIIDKILGLSLHKDNKVSAKNIKENVGTKKNVKKKTAKISGNNNTTSEVIDKSRTNIYQGMTAQEIYAELKKTEAQLAAVTKENEYLKQRQNVISKPSDRKKITVYGIKGPYDVPKIEEDLTTIGVDPECTQDDSEVIGRAYFDIDSSDFNKVKLVNKYVRDGGWTNPNYIDDLMFDNMTFDLDDLDDAEMSNSNDDLERE